MLKHGPNTYGKRSGGEFLLYQTGGGESRIECRFAGESTWLTQRLMPELFQTSAPNVTQHLKAICDDGELVRLP